MSAPAGPPGGPPGSGGPRALTSIERRKAVNALRDRLRPNVTDRSLLERYLETTNWDSDAAYNLWQADRARMLAGDDPQGSDSSSEDSEDDSSSDISPPASNAAAAGSSAPPPPPKAAPAAAAAAAAASPGSHASDASATSDNSNKKRTFKAMRESQIGPRFNSNLEQERRDAALALRLQFESEVDDGTTLSPSEAILLLHVNLWDLGEAIDSFTALDDIRLRLSDYDRMRTHLPSEVDPEEVDITREQDERLAEFMNITGRPDWWSLRVLLQEQNWNLIEAISFWFLRGVPPVHPSKKEVKRSTKADPKGNKISFGIRVGVNEMSLKWPKPEQCEAPAAIFMDDKWGVEPDQYTPEEVSDTQEDEEKKGKGKGKGKKAKKPRKGNKPNSAEGFLISVDGDPVERAYKGCPNPAKFLVEHISKGKYTFKRFRQLGKFQWPDLEKPKATRSQSGRVDFDWNNSSHIQLLNNWRRQAVGRTTKASKQDPGQPWSKEEDDYLIKLSEDLANEKKKKSTKASKETRLIVSTEKKEEWAEKFNKKFTGTVQAGSTEPRVDRTIAALMQRRCRIKELVDRFKVKADKKWFAKIELKADKTRKRSDVSDDEDAGPSKKTKADKKRKRSDVSDEEDAGPSKKTKAVADGAEDAEDKEESDGGEEVPMEISSGEDAEESDDDGQDAPMDLSD
ncbi:hypothetical protein AYO20_01827 [Fonsecaea nubica]|uniref:Uncharacterized protein n=1 Tax=Fonsecaea nubica TaxID=856822 RepID=A0A178DBD7_9EURO|nr:hypothetical protein AYO20_01827 [Fonsecaea nubica]OAL39076.1 hypothetical protein AYO20_01827 [Fonsecaea nubica]